MSILKEDLARTYSHAGGGRAEKLLECFRQPGTHAVVVLRFGQWLLRAPLIARVFLEPFYIYLDHRLRAKWGIQILRRATIGPGFYIGHYGGIFVAEGTVIGRQCSISQDVTLGIAGEGPRRGCPVIGDNVYIAPGAKVNGRIRIGNNVRIGPNAVVTKDVPDNALVHTRPVLVVVFPSRYGPPQAK
jgi:serine O-acetyltransferase